MPQKSRWRPSFAPRFFHSCAKSLSNSVLLSSLSMGKISSTLRGLLLRSALRPSPPRPLPPRPMLSPHLIPSHPSRARAPPSTQRLSPQTKNSEPQPSNSTKLSRRQIAWQPSPERHLRSLKARIRVGNSSSSVATWAEYTRSWKSQQR